MATIYWSENLSLKINSIDEQHKKLIELINSFYESINQDFPKEKMLELIKGMKGNNLISNHIIGTDKKYSDFFTKNEIK